MKRTKIKFPKSVFIRDNKYRIKVVTKIPGESNTTIGLCNWDKKVIHLVKNQSSRGMVRTFIHELLHALAYEYDFKLKHRTVYALEEAIEEFLEDNFQ